MADTNYGRSAVAAFTSHIAAQGGSMLQPFVVPVGTPDPASVLSEARALKPHVIEVLSPGADADEKVAQVNAAGAPAHLTTVLLYLSDVSRARGDYARVRATVPWYGDMDD